MKLKRRIIFFAILLTFTSVSAAAIEFNNDQFAVGNDVTSNTNYELFKDKHSIYNVSYSKDNSDIYKINYNNLFEDQNKQISFKNEKVKKSKKTSLLMLCSLTVLLCLLVVLCTNIYYAHRRRKNEYKDQYKC